jgi:hypothetical protein
MGINTSYELIEFRRVWIRNFVLNCVYCKVNIENSTKFLPPGSTWLSYIACSKFSLPLLCECIQTLSGTPNTKMAILQYTSGKFPFTDTCVAAAYNFINSDDLRKAIAGHAYPLTPPPSRPGRSTVSPITEIMSVCRNSEERVRGNLSKYIIEDSDILLFRMAYFRGENLGN